jgi:hypothetical protein
MSKYTPKHARPDDPGFKQELTHYVSSLLSLTHVARASPSP